MPVNAASLRQLAEPTPKEEIKQRTLMRFDQRTKRSVPMLKDGKPMELDYVDARYVFETLDQVCGPENWQSRFEDIPGEAKAIRAGIGILVERDSGESEWLWKWDVGTESSIEPMKGQHSDALKRAAVHWGIARDLYKGRDDDEAMAAVADEAPEEAPQPIRGGGGGAGTVMAPTPTVVAYGSGSAAITEAPDGTPTGIELVGTDLEASLPWICPLHNSAKLMPPGHAKASGRAYRAFWTCTERSCSEQGPRYEPAWWPAR